MPYSNPRRLSIIAVLAIAAWPLAAQNQTEQQYIDSVNTAINTLVSTLGTPTQPIVIGGNLVGAYGTKIGNMDLSVVLDWVDGLKAAGVQRIEFNPSMATLTHPGNVTAYNAIVRHIRELGLQLAINPEYEMGEIDPAPITNFAQFQRKRWPNTRNLPPGISRMTSSSSTSPIPPPPAWDSPPRSRTGRASFRRPHPSSRPLRRIRAWEPDVTITPR